MIIPAVIKTVANYATVLAVNEELGNPNFVDVVVPGFVEGKTVLQNLGFTTAEALVQHSLHCSVSVVDSTTVRVRVTGANDVTYNVTVNWQLVEFN